MTMVKPRLMVMMFLNYFVWSAWYVTLGTWLSQRLHFTGEQVGLVAGTTAVGAIVSPFLAGWVADTILPAEKVLALLHAVGAVLLVVASRQTSFGPLYTVVLAYAICFMPTLGLTNSIAFRHLTDTKREFGPIRVLGTTGWIVAGLLVGGLRVEDTALPMRIAAGASVVLAVFALVLPRTPPIARGRGFSLGAFAPPEARALFREKSFAVFVAASFLICIPLQFYYALTNLFMNQAGVVNAAGKMTGGQMSELGCMLLIPWFFRRLGVKGMLAAGMGAWVLRYLCFAYGDAGGRMWMLWVGIVLHGICYDFFFVTGQIYVDGKAPQALRAAAQGMITLITYGLGMFVGSWLSGAVLEHYSVPAAVAGGAVGHDWRPVWLIPAAISGVVLVSFLLVFSDRGLEGKREGVGEAMGAATAVPNGI